MLLMSCMTGLVISNMRVSQLMMILSCCGPMSWHAHRNLAHGRMNKSQRAALITSSLIVLS